MRFTRLPFTLPQRSLDEAIERLARAYARLQPGPVSRAQMGAVV